MASMDWKALLAELDELGLTQAEIASSVGCARSTICELRSGEIKNPGWKIASALQDLVRKQRRKAKRVAA